MQPSKLARKQSADSIESKKTPHFESKQFSLEPENEYIVELPPQLQNKPQNFQVDVLNQLISHKMKSAHQKPSGTQTKELENKKFVFEQVKNLQQKMKKINTNRAKKLRVPADQVRASSELGVYGEKVQQDTIRLEHRYPENFQGPSGTGSSKTPQYSHPQSVHSSLDFKFKIGITPGLRNYGRPSRAAPQKLFSPQNCGVT